MIFWSDKKRRKDVRSTPIDIREEDARDGAVYGAEILWTYFLFCCLLLRHWARGHGGVLCVLVDCVTLDCIECFRCRCRFDNNSTVQCGKNPDECARDIHIKWDVFVSFRVCFLIFSFYTFFSVLKPKGSALDKGGVLKVYGVFVYWLDVTSTNRLVAGDICCCFLMTIWNSIGIIFTSIRCR